MTKNPFYKNTKIKIHHVGWSQEGSLQSHHIICERFRTGLKSQWGLVDKYAVPCSFSFNLLPHLIIQMNRVLLEPPFLVNAGRAQIEKASGVTCFTILHEWLFQDKEQVPLSYDIKPFTVKNLSFLTEKQSLCLRNPLLPSSQKPLSNVWAI